MADDTFTLGINGEPFTFRLGDMTAMDAGDFRRELGVPLMKVATEGAWDLDVIAGLMWLVKRRNQPGLSYQAVAATLTYDSLDEDVAPTEEVAGDPEI